MTIGSQGLKAVAGLGLAAITCAGLASCSAAVLPDGAREVPDLMVSSPAASPGAPGAGTTFTLSVAVSNEGEGESAATTLRYYRSTDATITRSDTALGTAAIAGLAGSGSNSQSVELTAPSSPGTYYFGACVDPVTDESDTTNNCSDSVPVTVPVPEPKRPDLVVTSPRVSDSGPAAGAQFTLSATVRNDGEGTAAATTLRYYRSTDATITRSDTALETVAIAGLAGSGSSSQSVELTAPSSPGTYYYGACVDPVTDESDTTNNCSTSVRVDVPEPVAQSVEVTPRQVTLAALGNTAELTARVLDAQGNEIPGEAVSWYSRSPEVATVDAAGMVTAVANGRAKVVASASGVSGVTTVTVYQRAVTVDIDPGEVELTSVGDTALLTLRAFDANGHEVPDAGDVMSWAWRSANPNVAIVTTSPDIDLRATVRAVGTGTTTVTVTADGGRLSGTATVTVTEEGKPDLEILSIETLVGGVGNTYPLEAFQVEVSVLNDGDGPSEATTLRIYRSADTTVDTSDTEVGMAPVAGLAASEDADTAIRVNSPSAPGTYYYGACVDAVAGESDTSNNCSSAARVTVAEPGRPPDLVVVSPSISDSSPNAGAEFTLSATVRNRGEGPSSATTLRYYLSSSDRISTGDHEVGMAAVAGLAAGGESRQSATLAAPTEVRTYYYGACVDTVPRESEPYNNCSPAVPLVPRRPDLVARSPSISKTALDTGEEFTLSATVHNQGDGDAAATTLRYYLARRFLTTYVDNEVGAVAVAELVPAGSSEKSLTTTAPTDPRAEHFYRACVDAPPHETDKRNNCTAWVRYYLSNPQGRPDLAPSMLGVQPGDGIPPGHPVAFFPSVGNYGDRKSAPTTLRWYITTDSEHDSEETGSPVFTPENEIRTYAVGELYPWTASSDSWFPPPAPEETGYYQYGLCVDPVPGETERLDNCLSAFEMEIEVR